MWLLIHAGIKVNPCWMSARNEKIITNHIDLRGMALRAIPSVYITNEWASITFLYGRSDFIFFPLILSLQLVQFNPANTYCFIISTHLLIIDVTVRDTLCQRSLNWLANTQRQTDRIEELLNITIVIMAAATEIKLTLGVGLITG